MSEKINSITIKILPTLLIIINTIFFTACSFKFDDNSRSFTPRYSTTMNGNYTFIGNTILCEKNIDGTCKSDATDLNNKVFLKYIDVDSNTATFNSSEATLNIPTDSEIMWAGLYWTGNVHVSTYDNDFRNTITYQADDDIAINSSHGTYDAEKVIFTTPDGTSHNISSSVDHATPANSDFNYYSYGYSSFGSTKWIGSTYSAFYDVTTKLQALSSNANGTYRVSQIQTQQCPTIENADQLNNLYNDSMCVTEVASYFTLFNKASADVQAKMAAVGNVGAWALAVVYKNSNEKSRNITVFDGYKTVDPDEANQVFTLNGFYTPTTTPVTTTISSFSTEGDKSFTGDFITVNGQSITNIDDTINPPTNIFNSTMGSFSRNPKLNDNLGIDIDTFEVGQDGNSSHPQIIGTNQTEANITVGTTDDLFTMSSGIFSTQMYNPNICLSPSIIDNDGVSYDYALTNSKLSFTINKFSKETTNFKFALYNQTNPLESVNSINDATVMLTFDKNITLPTAIYIKEPADLDFHSISFTTTLIDNNISFLLNGLQAGKYTYIDFNTTVTPPLTGENNVSIDLDIKYTFTIGGTDLQISLNPQDNVCPSGYSDEKGVLDLVSSYAYDLNNSSRQLYTQIANKSFQTYIIAFNDDETFNTLQSVTDKNITIDFVDTQLYGGVRELICNDINSRIYSPENINLNSNPYTKTLTIPSAFRSIAARFSYCKNDSDSSFSFLNSSFGCDAGSTISYRCSTDDFSVRPYALDVTPLDTNILFRSGDTNDTTVRAINEDISTATGYTQVISANNIQSNIQSWNGTKYDTNSSLDGSGFFIGGTNTLSSNSDLYFVSGQNNTMYFTYNNAGKIYIDINDTTWTQTDIDENDCTFDFSNNLVDGKLGCYFKTIESSGFTYLPHHYNLTTGALQNFNPADFTYYSNQPDKTGANINTPLVITAVNKTNGTTSNYSQGLYQEPISVTLSLTDDNVTRNGSLLIAQTPIENDFSNGFVTLNGNDLNKTRISWKRDSNTTPSNPMIVNDFANLKYTADDNNETNGTTSITGGSATFYYGRLHSPNYRTDQDPFTATIYTEVFCDLENCTDYGITNTWTESIDNVFWWINPNHTATMGTIYSIDANTTIMGVQDTGINTPIAIPATAPLFNIVINLNAATDTPHTTFIHIGTDTWLNFNHFANNIPPFFKVEFLQHNSGTFGVKQGNLDTAINFGVTGDTAAGNVDTTQRTNKRITW